MTTGSVVDVKWPDITVGEQREHNCYAREGTNFLCHDNGEATHFQGNGLVCKIYKIQ